MKEYIECTTCGRRVNAQLDFCPACGAAVERPKIEEPIPAPIPHPFGEMRAPEPERNAGDPLAHRTESRAQDRFEDMCDAIEYLKFATVKVTCSDKDGKMSNGTAFFVEESGGKYLVTNYHVVSEASEPDGYITVSFPAEIDREKRSYMATVIDYDPINDIALLNPEIGGLSSFNYLTLCDTSTVRQGESIITVGNPRGMEFNSLAGYVVNTEFNEEAGQMTRILCSMNAAPGNSGGAVARAKDCSVIGIATEIFKPDFIASHLICTPSVAIKRLISIQKPMIART